MQLVKPNRFFRIPFQEDCMKDSKKIFSLKGAKTKKSSFKHPNTKKMEFPHNYFPFKDIF